MALVAGAVYAKSQVANTNCQPKGDEQDSWVLSQNYDLVWPGSFEAPARNEVSEDERVLRLTAPMGTEGATFIVTNRGWPFVFAVQNSLRGI